MKLINRKNYLSMVCIFYTFLSLCKVVLESFILRNADENQMNFLWMFIIALLATFVISLHYYFQELPVWLVIIGQYLLLLILLMIGLWIYGCFFEVDPNADRDIFLSFTVPYMIGAAFYYIKFYLEVRKANNLLFMIKKEKKSNRGDE